MGMSMGGGGRSQWFVLLALVFGLLAAGLTWSGLQQAQAQQEEVQTRVAPVPVVMAAQDIPPRTLLTAELLDVREVPRSAVHPDAVAGVPGQSREELIEQVVGRSPKQTFSKQTIFKGEPILLSKLFAERGEAGLAFTIPLGKRAVAVATSEVMGSGGLILPGDHVDVVAICRATVEGATQPAPAGGTIRYTEHVRATYALQDVEVLAVGQLLTGTEPEPSTAQRVAGAGTSPPREVPRVNPQAQPAARTVTLAVAPEQAQRLILYSQLCGLSLAARRFDDRKVDAVPAEELNFGIVK